MLFWWSLHASRIDAGSLQIALWRSRGSTPRLRGWERSSRDVNSIGGTGYTGYSYFRRCKGLGVSDKVGRVWCPPTHPPRPVERKDASGSAAYIELEPFEYRHMLEGVRQAAGDIEGSKVDTRSSSRDSSYPYMITQGPPTTGVSSPPSERISAQSYPANPPSSPPS